MKTETNEMGYGDFNNETYTLTSNGTDEALSHAMRVDPTLTLQEVMDAHDVGDDENPLKYVSDDPAIIRERVYMWRQLEAQRTGGPYNTVFVDGLNAMLDVRPDMETLRKANWAADVKNAVGEFDSEAKRIEVLETQMKSAMDQIALLMRVVAKHETDHLAEQEPRK